MNHRSSMKIERSWDEHLPQVADRRLLAEFVSDSALVGEEPEDLVVSHGFTWFIQQSTSRMFIMFDYLIVMMYSWLLLHLDVI